ncbi:MAG: hypothetical protein ACLR1R_02070 [Ruminococcus callidus]
MSFDAAHCTSAPDDVVLIEKKAWGFVTAARKFESPEQPCTHGRSLAFPADMVPELCSFPAVLWAVYFARTGKSAGRLLEKQSQ